METTMCILTSINIVWMYVHFVWSNFGKGARTDTSPISLQPSQNTYSINVSICMFATNDQIAISEIVSCGMLFYITVCMRH